MEFLYAISGWQWALAAGTPAAIVALYFLKLKRKPLEVPSTFLWKKSIEDLHVNSLWQRLRKSLLLWLQLAVAALVIVSLLRPTVHATRTGRHFIIMVDNSASMSATDIEPTRLGDAKRKAALIADQMQSGDAGMVIAFADSARVVCSYTENVPAIKQAIASIQPTARKTRLREALVIASGLANPQRSGEEDAAAVPAELYLLSDGKFPPVDDVPLGNLNMHYLSVGATRENVGLVALSARRSESGPDRTEVFGRVRNLGEETADLTAELHLDGQLASVQRLHVGGGQEQPVLFPVAAVESATISVRIDRADAFDKDNEAWTVISPPRRIRMLVVGDENAVLKAVLATEPLAKAAQMDFRPRSFAATDFAADSSFGAYDLVVFDRCAPQTMPECNTFFIGAAPASLAAEKTPVKAPIILNWDASHPVLRFLDLDDVNVVDAFTTPLPQGGVKLIESDRGPLLFTVQRSVHTDLVQTFAIVDENGHWRTDWPLKLSFPLYMMNIVQGLGGAESAGQTVFAPGDTVSLPIETEADVVRVEHPGGRTTEVRRTRQGRFEFLDTEELGVYRVEAGEQSRRFAVNLFDEFESSVGPSEKVQVGAVDVADTSASFSARRELWKVAALLGFVVLVLEWYVYNRRVYI